jgi:hypothetical protein
MFAALLVGPPAAANHLAEIVSPPITESLAVSEAGPIRLTLRPLSLEETGDYVRQSLHAVAGRCDLWSDSAIIRLFELTGGRLAQLAIDAEAAMMLAAHYHRKLIGPEIVQSARRENSRHFASARAA